MILSKDINPEYSLYNVGATILEALIELDKESSFRTLYLTVSNKHKINVGLFSLGVDWLYILGTIDLKEDGVIKCI